LNISFFEMLQRPVESTLDLHKPVNVPQILREFTTPAAAYEHGLALGHILTSIY